MCVGGRDGGRVRKRQAFVSEMERMRGETEKVPFEITEAFAGAFTDRINLMAGCIGCEDGGVRNFPNQLLHCSRFGFPSKCAVHMAVSMYFRWYYVQQKMLCCFLCPWNALRRNFAPEFALSDECRRKVGKVCSNRAILQPHLAPQLCKLRHHNGDETRHQHCPNQGRFVLPGSPPAPGTRTGLLVQTTPGFWFLWFLWWMVIVGFNASGFLQKRR